MIRRAITEMPIYEGPGEFRLDERALAGQLGISRTPVREAILRLESEGLVQTVPRRGIYVVRKSKKEIIEVILASAAVESMAARLAAVRATDEEIASIRAEFPEFSAGDRSGRRSAEATGLRLDEYSEMNIAFHQRIVDLAHSELFSQLVSGLQVHMRAIRNRALGDERRRARSVVDHAHIVKALEARDADRLDEHVRQHAIDLADHVERNITDLD